MSVKRSPDSYRASAIRERLRKRRAEVTDIERAWLERYDATVAANWHKKTAPPPRVDPDQIVAVVLRRYSVTRERLLYMGRGEIEVELARAVAACAIRKVGATFQITGVALNRAAPGVCSMIQLHSRRPFVQREVAAVLAEVARVVAKPGDVVEVSVRVVVGDPLWREIDRRSESEESGHATLQRVSGRDTLAAE